MKDPSRWVYKGKNVKDEKYDTEKHERQRAKRGFSTYDWWGFDSYLTFVIIGGLKKFKKDGMGYPGSLLSMDGWLEILDDMIDGFEALEELKSMRDFDTSDGVKSYDEWAKPLLERWEKGSKLFIEYYPDLWD